MSSICRLCATLKKNHNFINLNEINLNLCHKLEKCCQLYINLNDNLPKNVCIDCVTYLDKSWKFYIKVHEAQESLINVFGYHESKIDVLQGNEDILEKLKNPSKNICSNKDDDENDDIEYDDDANDGKRILPSSSILSCVPVVETLTIEQICQEDINYDDDDGDGDDESDINMKVTEFIVKDYQNNINDVEILEENLNLHSNNYKNNKKFHQSQQEHDYEKEEMNLIKQIDFNFAEIKENSDDNDDNHDDNKIDIKTEKKVINNNEKILMQNYEDETWNNYPWKCIKCNSYYTNVINFLNHVEENHNHNNVNDNNDKNLLINYYCIDCMKLFTKYYTFINHVKFRHRNYLQFNCDICSKYFNNFQLLCEHRKNSHLNILNDNNNIDLNFELCLECGKAFKNLNSLQIHLNCHKPYDVKYKYLCELCNKKFGTKPNLKAHKKIHMGLKEFICSQCGKDFVQKANLEEHLLSHKNDCPYECKECNKRFKTPARLTKHKIVHTDVKPFECKICGKLFREKDTLKVHSRIHTGAMPFNCEYCGKKFRFKSVFTTHRHQHTGVRPYSCIDCNHHFTNWPNYNKHMKRRHGIDTSSSALRKKSQNEIVTENSNLKIENDDDDTDAC